jgi:DnaJ family protein B protein 4
MGVCGERLRPAAVRAVTGGITRHAWVAWSAQVKGSPSEEILEIAVKPGWKKGTKITFQEKGARPAGRGRGGAQGGLGCRGGMPRPLTAAAWRAAAAGDEEPGVIPADIVFVLDEKPHAIFKWGGPRGAWQLVP